MYVYLSIYLSIYIYIHWVNPNVVLARSCEPSPSQKYYHKLCSSAEPNP